jgi:hypothetical protein
MPLGTQGQTNYKLAQLKDCYIRVPQLLDFNIGIIPITAPFYIFMNNLPDITDTHDAQFGDQNGIGRSMPLKTFGQGGPRVINWTVNFIAETEEEAERNLTKFRALAACTYPRKITRNDMPYMPPPMVYIKCGKLLANEELCAVVKSYNVKWPKDVPWTEKYYIPYRFEVAVTLEVVYVAGNMPGAERIFTRGG